MIVPVPCDTIYAKNKYGIGPIEHIMVIDRILSRADVERISGPSSLKLEETPAQPERQGRGRTRTARARRQLATEGHELHAKHGPKLGSSSCKASYLGQYHTSPRLKIINYHEKVLAAQSASLVSPKHPPRNELGARLRHPQRPQCKRGTPPQRPTEHGRLLGLHPNHGGLPRQLPLSLL